MRDLLVREIRDLYSAERQLADALPQMMAAATHQDLKDAIAQHLEETRGHVARLESVATALGISPEGGRCEAMRGLIEEGADRMKELGEPIVKDAALIAAAQRIEHYEIAGYGCAATFADHCGEGSARDLLHATLEEERATDGKLSKLATGGVFSAGINQEATSV